MTHDPSKISLALDTPLGIYVIGFDTADGISEVKVDSSWVQQLLASAKNSCVDDPKADPEQQLRKLLSTGHNRVLVLCKDGSEVIATRFGSPHKDNFITTYRNHGISFKEVKEVLYILPDPRTKAEYSYDIITHQIWKLEKPVLCKFRSSVKPEEHFYTEIAKAEQHETEEGMEYIGYTINGNKRNLKNFIEFAKPEDVAFASE